RALLGQTARAGNVLTKMDDAADVPKVLDKLDESSATVQTRIFHAIRLVRDDKRREEMARHAACSITMEFSPSWSYLHAGEVRESFNHTADGLRAEQEALAADLVEVNRQISVLDNEQREKTDRMRNLDVEIRNRVDAAIADAHG